VTHFANFRETLGRHLLAMETKDLETLAATLADKVVLITADGTLKRSKPEFVEAHRGWFGLQGWTLKAKAVEIYESASLGVAVLHVEYREGEGWLTLVFERRGNEWLVVQHQNTPVRR
jgi:ketosteroid isomerase-like protein